MFPFSRKIQLSKNSHFLKEVPSLDVNSLTPDAPYYIQPSGSFPLFKHLTSFHDKSFTLLCPLVITIALEKFLPYFQEKYNIKFQFFLEALTSPNHHQLQQKPKTARYNFQIHLRLFPKFCSHFQKCIWKLKTFLTQNYTQPVRPSWVCNPVLTRCNF